MGCVVSLALVATAAALTPAEVVRTICPHCESRDMTACWAAATAGGSPIEEEATGTG